MASLYNQPAGNTLDPDDYNAFQTQKRQADRAYGIGTAQNRFRKNDARLNYLKQTRDLNQNYGVTRRGFGAELNNRGLLNSGIYNQSYLDLQNQRMNADSDLKSEFDQQLAGLREADDQLATINKGAKEDVEAAQAARTASVAAALKYAKEFG